MKIFDAQFILEKPLTWLDNRTTRLEPVKIIKRIQLRDYAPEFGSAYLEVWVNPTADLLEKWQAYIMELAKAQIPADLPESAQSPEDIPELARTIRDLYDRSLQVYSVLLSQGRKKTRVSVEDLRQLIDRMNDTDPRFWGWVKRQIAELISEHRLGSRAAFKNFTGKDRKNYV
jgi:hypothetical protein